MSRSVELNEDLVERALKTFTMSYPFKDINNQELGPITSSLASRITGSAQTTDVNHNERLKKNKNQPNATRINEICVKVEPGRRVRQ